MGIINYRIMKSDKMQDDPRSRFFGTPKNRSDNYQVIYAEMAWGLISTTNDDLTDTISDEMKELRQELLEALLDLADQILTERQHQILTLYLQGYTQVQMAQKIGCNQSSINKGWKGNTDYSGPVPVNHGGIIKKLRTAAHEDPTIQNILKKIAESTQPIPY